MKYVSLKRDGRCKWLEKKVLNGILPRAQKLARDPFAHKLIIIVDWISSDSGRVGVDLKWLKSLGVPAVASYHDLPKNGNFAVVNTGYDSIVHEESLLKNRGIEIIDLPCPFIRKVRKIFEQCDPSYQYVLLCEQNHIIIRNFDTLFPDDMILVQMQNYRTRILQRQNGKPVRLVPYVTFLPCHVDEVFAFIQQNFPDRCNDKLSTFCMWVRGAASPITEINKMANSCLNGIEDALLITTPGSMNKSLMSLHETLEHRGLNVIPIGSLKEFWNYASKHRKNKSKVLLVKSPIPNKAERPIMAYLKYGRLVAWLVCLIQTRIFQACSRLPYNKAIYYAKLLLRSKKHVGEDEIASTKPRSLS
ncbi:MAG: hypothetical protein KAI50_04925 [Desulfobacterales bacterium]|nr:hypothetical protein [Desulfobacterales bacterium]